MTSFPFFIELTKDRIIWIYPFSILGSCIANVTDTFDSKIACNSFAFNDLIHNQPWLTHTIKVLWSEDLYWKDALRRRTKTKNDRDSLNGTIHQQKIQRPKRGSTTVLNGAHFLRTLKCAGVTRKTRNRCPFVLDYRYLLVCMLMPIVVAHFTAFEFSGNHESLAW